MAPYNWKIRSLFWALVLLCTPAFVAQSSARPEADACTSDPVCDRHYLKAQVYSKASRLSDALVEYQGAYARRPVPRLLFNIARLLHKLDRLPEAATAYHAYLGMSGIEETVRAKAQEYLAEVEHAQSLSAPPVSPPRPPSPLEPSQPMAVATPDLQVKESSSSSSAASDSATAASKPSRSGAMMGLGATLSLLGVSAAGIGISALVVNGSCAQMVSTPAGSQCEQVYNSNLVGYIMLPAGIVLLGGGVALFAYGAKPRIRH